MQIIKPLVRHTLTRAAAAQPVMPLKDVRPLLKTSAGGMIGTSWQVSDGQHISAFLSVPFAKPPVAKLRFEAPVAPRYVPVREATRMPSASHESEDCLYLNLFVPAEPSSDRNKYPLLLFVPGGGFDRNKCASHSTPYMAEHYCRRGIVYATLQYRVGLFGFGSDGSEDFPGNYALHDVCQALKFLHENADQIGFDPNRITVAGHSAGAAILSALSVAPKSKDLFSQVIQFSGSSLSLISTGNLVENETRKIVNRLNTGGGAVPSPKKFLKQFSADDIFRVYQQIGPPMNGANVIRFSPRVDGDFFPKDYFDLICDASPKPTLNTNSQNEGIVFALFNYLKSIAEVKPSQALNFNAEAFRQKIRDLFISDEIWGNLREHGVDKIYDFYANRASSQDDMSYLLSYTKAIHDCYFAVPARMEMLEKIRCGWPVYNATFERLHPVVYPPNMPFRVPTHGSEHIYLFGHLKNTEQLFDETDKLYRDFWIESIVDFVKNSNPRSSQNPQWICSTNHETGLVLRACDNKLLLESNLHDKELQFWNDLNKLAGYNIVRQMQLTDK